MKWTLVKNLAITLGICFVLVATADTVSTRVPSSNQIGEGTYRPYTWYRILKLGLAPYVDPDLVDSAETGYAYKLPPSGTTDGETECRLFHALVKGEVAIAARNASGELEISKAVQKARKREFAQVLEAWTQAAQSGEDDGHRLQIARLILRGGSGSQHSTVSMVAAHQDSMASNIVSSDGLVIRIMSDASSEGHLPKSTPASLEKKGQKCTVFTLWLSQLQAEQGDLSFVGLSPQIGTLNGERVVAWDFRAFASAWGELH